MIPKQLQYGSKINGIPARSIRTNVQPQTGTTFNLGNTIQLNIPTRPNLVMCPSESYLKFTLMAMTSTANSTTVRLDSGGAHGLIQRIRIFHGSNLLQDIDNYGLMAKMLFDLQVSTPQAYGKYAVTSGTRQDFVTNLASITASVADPATLAAVGTYFNSTLRLPVKTRCVNSGHLILKSDGTNVLASGDTSSTYTFCINLISLIGSLCPQYLPLFAMKSAPLRVEITLIDDLLKAFAITGGTPTVANGVINSVEFVAQMIELSDEAMSVVNSNLNGQPLQFVFPDYRNFQNTFAVADNVSINLPIPAKFTSLKSLFVLGRDKNTGASTYFPHSCVKYGLSSYYFRIGALTMPSSAPSSTAEMFSEALKAIGSLSDLNHHPSIDRDAYELSASVANTAALETYGASSVNSGSFYIGIDLENYNGASKDSYFAGWNSNTDDIYCVLNYGAVPAGITMRYDAFALYDSLLVCEHDTAYVRF